MAKRDAIEIFRLYRLVKADARRGSKEKQKCFKHVAIFIA